MVVAFDSNGWLAVFIFGLVMIPVIIFLYLHELHGKARPSRVSRFRGGIWTVLFGTFLAGLRRFVIHQ